MARIIKATDHGYRKVVHVAKNSNDAQWVHPEDNGVAHSGVNARAADTFVIGVDLNGKKTRERVRGIVETGLAAGSACHACQNNWNIFEAVLEGADYEMSTSELHKKIKAALADPGDKFLRLVSRSATVPPFPAGATIASLADTDI